MPTLLFKWREVNRTLKSWQTFYPHEQIRLTHRGLGIVLTLSPSIMDTDLPKFFY